MAKRITNLLVLLLGVLLCAWLPAHAQRHTLDTFPSLVSDHRPYKVGQLLTILIFEEASSTTSADTKSSKSTDVSGRLRINNVEDGGALNIANSEAGQGSISRKGRLIASVSATVEEVMPGGELRIFGEQKIEFNDEVQHIRVAGMVRPEDIASNNTVLSSRIAHSEITYVGDGLLGNRQKPGWITRLYNWLF